MNFKDSLLGHADQINRLLNYILTTTFYVHLFVVESNILEVHVSSIHIAHLKKLWTHTYMGLILPQTRFKKTNT